MVEVSNHGHGEVQFIHETVRTFLLGAHGLALLAPDLRDNVEGVSQERIKDVCLQYIQQRSQCQSSVDQQFGDESETQHGPTASLLNYALANIMSHADSAQRHGISQQCFLLHLRTNAQNDSQT